MDEEKEAKEAEKRRRQRRVTRLVVRCKPIPTDSDEEIERIGAVRA